MKAMKLHLSRCSQEELLEAVLSHCWSPCVVKSKQPKPLTALFFLFFLRV